MTLVLDIVLIGIVVALIAISAKKGFILTILEVVAIVAALIFASYISEPISQGAYDTFLKGSIIKAIDSEIDGKTVSNNIGDIAFDAIPEYALDFAECAGVDTAKVKNDINSTISKAVSSGKYQEVGERVEENCIRPVAVPAIGIIMYFILFAIFALLFRLIAGIVAKSIKFSLVEKADVILGGFIGAVKGVAVLLVISTVLVTMLSKGDSEFAVAINESKVLEAINEINPFTEKLQQLFN